MSPPAHSSRTRRCSVVWLVAVWLLCIAPAAAQTHGVRGAAARSNARVRPVAAVAERVVLETDDKIPVLIVGTYTPPPADSDARRSPACILLHMYGENRSTFQPLVPELHAAGFAVLAVDLRGHGESIEPAALKLAEKMEDRDPRLFRYMIKDVEAAYRWLSRRPDVDPARLVLVGASVGGSIALEYAARDKSVDGLVLLTPGVDYLSIDARVSARRLKDRPVLMLVAEEERRDADDLAKEIPGSKVVIVGPRPAGEHSMALHGTRMLGKAAGVEKTITDFLIKAAGPSSDRPVVGSMIGEVYYDPASSRANRLSPDNLRTFSSAAEAESRGYRPPKQRRRR